MVHRNGRFSALLAMALTLSAMLSACSDDTSVGTGPPDPFNERSCFEFTDYLHTVSLVETPGWALAVDIADGLAYVADANNGLQIVDYRIPSAPIFRGRVGASQPALDVVAVDDIVCLSLGADGVAVVDVGDPDRPIIVGRVGTPGSTAGITLRGTIAYVADDVAGLMLIDVGDPEAPNTVGVDNTPGLAVDVAVSGAFAYVADRRRGLKVVNVNNPADPWWVNNVPLSSGGRGVDVADGFAFVAAGLGGLLIVDVSTPGAEAVVGSLATGGPANYVAVEPGTEVAFVAQGWSGVEVVDVSDPYAPEVLNILTNAAEALGVSTERGVTVIARRGDGLQALNTASPLPPPVTATMPDRVSHVVARSGMVFGAGPGIGLFGVEMGDSILRTSGTLALPYEVVDLFISGDTAFVASENGGIEMVDVTDPTDFYPAGWVPYQGGVVSIDAVGRILCFVGGRVFGTWVWGDQDVTTLDISSTTTTVEAEGEYAYVGSRTGGLFTIYIGTPNRPLQVSVTQIDGGAEDIVAADGRLFILTSGRTSNGVGVYDLPMPNQPVRAGFVNLLDKPQRAALSETYLYVAVGGAGMVVIDVSDPSNPLRIGTVPSGDASMAVAVAGGSVFVADRAGGMFTVRAQECAPSP